MHGLTQIFRSRRIFWRRQRITLPIPKQAAAIWVVSTSISMLHFYLQQCFTIGDMVLSCLVLKSHALRASRWKKVVKSPRSCHEIAASLHGRFGITTKIANHRKNRLCKRAFSVRQWFSRKSGFKLWNIQNGVSDLDRLQTIARNFVFVSNIFVPGNVL